MMMTRSKEATNKVAVEIAKHAIRVVVIRSLPFPETITVFQEQFYLQEEDRCTYCVSMEDYAKEQGNRFSDQSEESRGALGKAYTLNFPKFLEDFNIDVKGLIKTCI